MHSGTFYHVQRGPARRRLGVLYPQQSTAFLSPSQYLRNFKQIFDVSHLSSKIARVSCNYWQVVSEPACPNGSRSEPLTWSKGAAGKMAIYASIPATWCSRAGNASIWAAILPDR